LDPFFLQEDFLWVENTGLPIHQCFFDHSRFSSSLYLIGKVFLEHPAIVIFPEFAIEFAYWP